MRINITLVLLLIAMLSACQTYENQAQKTMSDSSTLYQQLGGEKKVRVVIEKMVKKLHKDERLSELFTEVDDIELTENLIDFICLISGGGCEYQGAEMEDIHAELFITKAEFDRFVSLFIFSMKDAHIPFTAQNRLLDKLAKLRHTVIEL